MISTLRMRPRRRCRVNAARLADIAVRERPPVLPGRAAIPGTLATLAAGAWIDAGDPGRLARGQSYRLATSKTSSRKRGR
jgi:hypothetical protein